MRSHTMHTVTVLDYDGSLLAGCRPKRARKLMKAKRARPVKYNGSFAIQLMRKREHKGNFRLENNEDYNTALINGGNNQ
jgi:hypothetical protein